MPVPVVEQMFATNLFGPIRLTKGLLPGMRAAGRGRVVVVSSHAATSGMAAVSAYGASKSALERWAESLSVEIAPFGLGVSVLVTGTFKTDILELTQSWKDDDRSLRTAPCRARVDGRQDGAVRSQASSVRARGRARPAGHEAVRPSCRRARRRRHGVRQPAPPYALVAVPHHPSPSPSTGRVAQMFTLRFDMRAPTWAAPIEELYAAAVEMAAWAESRGAVPGLLSSLDLVLTVPRDPFDSP